MVNKDLSEQQEWRFEQFVKIPAQVFLGSERQVADAAS